MRLEIDIQNFVQKYFHVSARAQSRKLFDDAVGANARQLLKENRAYTPMPLHELVAAELFKLDPKMALEAFELFSRAMQAKLPGRKVDAKKILSERVRLIRAKSKVNSHRRRII